MPEARHARRAFGPIVVIWMFRGLRRPGSPGLVLKTGWDVALAGEDRPRRGELASVVRPP